VAYLGGKLKPPRLLLPVLRHSRSPFVLDLVHSALRSIHRNFHSTLGPDLKEELRAALDDFDVKKLEVVK
jgi:hypothetical protein